MFTPCGLGGLVCQTRHIRLIVRKVSINGSCWVPIFLLLFFFLLILLNLSVGDVTTVLFEVVELITHRTKALLGEKNYVAWESGTGQRRSGLPSVEGLLLATAPQIQQGRERTESQIPFFENLPLSWSRLDKLLSVGQVLPQKRGSKLDFKLVVSLVDRPKLFEGLVGELEHVFFLIKLPKQYSRCIFRLIWSNL